MADQSTSMASKSQLAIVAVALVLVAGVGGFWFGWSTARKGDEAVTEQNEALDLSNALLRGNAVSVTDQSVGMSVEIASVSLAQDGWVVIHDDLDSKSGRILGAQRFNAGQNQLGRVELLRSTEASKVYYAMIHADDGDRQFDHTKDLPITDPQGNAVMSRFTTSGSAPQ